LTRTLYKLERFAELVEEMLGAESISLDVRLGATAEKYPESERAEYFEAHAEDSFELSDELPSILRYSVLTRADSALENYLVSTAVTFAELHKPSVVLKDFVGTGFRRAQQYLKKVAGVQFPEDAPEWVAVLRLRELRTCVVHADGYINEDHGVLKRWINATPGIRVFSSRSVTLAADFSGTAIGWYIRFAELFDPCCEGLGLWASVFPVDDA
jgi:hypothetical protein